MVVRIRACSDHLDLVFAAIDWPVLASSADDLDLLKQISLIPAELYLHNLVILIEADEVRLVLLATTSLRMRSTHHWQGSSSVDNEIVKTW